jgi:hypothetical protein
MINPATDESTAFHFFIVLPPVVICNGLSDDQVINRWLLHPKRKQTTIDGCHAPENHGPLGGNT